MYCKSYEGEPQNDIPHNLIGTFCIVNITFAYGNNQEMQNLIGTFCIVNSPDVLENASVIKI